MSQNIIDVMKAIKSVEQRLREAIIKQDYNKKAELSADLIALDVCLRIETQKVINEHERKIT